MTRPTLLFAGDSIGGSAHKNAHGAGMINSQDSFEYIYAKDGSVIGGVICDGCGDKLHSEVGAKIGAIALSKLIGKECEHNLFDIDWEKITKGITAMIKEEAVKFENPGKPFVDIVKEYFLFTILVAVFHKNQVVVAGCGDGIYMVDDVVETIKTEYENAPPYVAYNLIESDYNSFPDQTKIREIISFPIEGFEKSIIIGSDGAYPLVKAHLDEIHHPVFIAYPEQLRIWLNAKVYSQEKTQLFDDISLLIIRTPAIQEKLFAEKSEIGTLKSRVEHLETLLANKESIIENQDKTISDLREEVAEEKNRRSSWSIFPRPIYTPPIVVGPLVSKSVTVNRKTIPPRIIKKKGIIS